MDPIQAVVNELKAEMATMTKDFGAVKEQVTKLSETPAPGRQSPFGLPNVRRGEDPMSSRGYSFLRAMGFISRRVDAEYAKVECDVHNRLQKALTEGTDYVKASTNSFVVPFSTEHLGLPDGQEAFIGEIRSLVAAGVAGADPYEVFQMRVKQWGMQRALSWIDTTTGGALVAPPVMGELIDLYRNNCALLDAGIREIAMPPSGRITFPRQTAGGTAYWVGESVAITESNPTTGDLVLQAKKLGILMRIPNELMKFASRSIEQFLREDMSRVMALKVDKSGLEGVGSTYEPKGLIKYSGITSHTAATVGADGDTFEPEDVGDMIGKCEEQNATFKAFIGRPLVYSKIANRRADGPVPGDRKGAFLFNVWRDKEDNMNRGRGKGNLEGYPFVKSTNVAQTRTKGSASNLTYILGGDFSDVVMAHSGVIEFFVANQGDTMVAQDQTLVRGIHYCDLAPRHEASLVLCDTLVVG